VEGLTRGLAAARSCGGGKPVTTCREENGSQRGGGGVQKIRVVTRKMMEGST
jgi:hypothetical protein